MKKLIAGASAAATYASVWVTYALAQGQGVKVEVTAPKSGIKPDADIGKIIENALAIVYAIGALLVLVYLILGAFNWITSGGDKEKVKNARGQIIAALTGLAILALAALITNVVARLLGFGDILNFKIPWLGEGA